MNSNYVVNDQIQKKSVRLITPSGEQIGVIPTVEAKKRAQEEGLDLVAINYQLDVPVCKILDFGKFKYEQHRKERELAKKNRENRIDVKEIQLRPNIDDNDLKVKAKRAKSFLADGDKVKVVMKFRGREIAHVDVGNRVIDTFLSHVEDYRLERPVARSERQLLVTLLPKVVTSE